VTPSALNKEHPALQNFKVLDFFYIFWAIFALSNPDPDSGSSDLIESGSVRNLLTASVADSGNGAILNPGSGIRDDCFRITDPKPSSNHFLGYKYLYCLSVGSNYFCCTFSKIKYYNFVKLMDKKGRTNNFFSSILFFVLSGSGIREGRKSGSGIHPGSAALLE
jgi:hypothetical protein